MGERGSDLACLSKDSDNDINEEEAAAKPLLLTEMEMVGRQHSPYRSVA